MLSVFLEGFYLFLLILFVSSRLPFATSLVSSRCLFAISLVVPRFVSASF